jgi:hypothetical protein
VTREEALNIREALDGFVTKIVDSPAEINDNMAAIRNWKEAVYVTGDVRMFDGIPYKCVQAHDSTGNATWNPPATPSLWMQYHGTTVETARNWVAPTGAHDQYVKGEWMIWTDGAIYECIQDTVYDPSAYSQSWKNYEN